MEAILINNMAPIMFGSLVVVLLLGYPAAFSLGAVGIAAGSLVSLLVSEYTPLFGFMESGYRLAIVLAIVFDVLTTVFLGVFIAPGGAIVISQDDATFVTGEILRVDGGFTAHTPTYATDRHPDR